MMRLIGPGPGALVFTTCVTVLGGCFSDGEKVDEPDEPVGVAVEEVVEGLEHPWGLAFLPDTRELALVTERPGRLRLVNLDNGSVDEISGLPDIAAVGQGGLLDVAMHPDYPNQPWVYLAYSAEGAGGYATHVGRGQLDLETLRLQSFEELFVATPFTSNSGHFGSRMVFDAAWKLYVTVGDRRQRDSAQDLTSHHGKTLRLEADGSIPDDNPFVDDPDVEDAIYSYGHRNAQGMAVNPATTEIWQHEHGQMGGDEINILQEAGNFGWPIATYGREYNSGEPIGDLPPDNPDTTDPIHYWEEDAFPPSGMAFYAGDAFPRWQGSLFIGALGREYLARFTLSGNVVGEEERLLENRGWRIRDVRVSPHDGYVYVLVDAPDAPLVRLVPTEDGTE